MKTFIIILLIGIIYFISGIMHEKDLSRNFNETGDAKALFYDIKR